MRREVKSIDEVSAIEVVDEKAVELYSYLHKAGIEYLKNRDVSLK